MPWNYSPLTSPSNFLDVLTVYVRTTSHVTAGTLLVPLALQLPEFGPIVVNIWFYSVVIQAQP